MSDTPLSLGTRDGLPDALRVLVNEIPRDAWSAHPDFGGMVAFWLDRHMMFRKLLGILETDAKALVGQTISFEEYAPRLSRYGGMFLNELHGHHQIEDTQYFPRLSKLDPRIEAGFALLEADHEAMDGLLHDMAGAANAVLQGGTPERFADHLIPFHRMLDRHLLDEEDIIVPVILKSGFTG